MRYAWMVLVLVAGVALGLVLDGKTSDAQQLAPPHPPGNQAMLTMQMRGAQKGLSDTVKGVLVEYDPPRTWDLLIIGSKGKGQFTCEVRSADKQLLFDIQRTILFGRETSVSCANGLPSARGGVVIDLDDPKGGSFVLGAQR